MRWKPDKPIGVALKHGEPTLSVWGQTKNGKIRNCSPVGRHLDTLQVYGNGWAVRTSVFFGDMLKKRIWMTKYFTIRKCTKFFNVTFGPLIDCLRYSRRYRAIQLWLFQPSSSYDIDLDVNCCPRLRTTLPVHGKNGRKRMCVQKGINKYHCDLYCQKKTCCQLPTATELCASIICTCVSIPSLAT